MEPERWERLRAAFEHALELAGPEREAWLARAFAGEAELERQLRRMLAEDEEAAATQEDLLELLTAGRLTPLLGRRLGAYRITNEIARGGMGLVCRGERADGLFEHEVAIKLILADSAGEQAHRRFEIERRALAALNHPNIARLYDGGTTAEGWPYLVMELVRGQPIDQHCRERRLGLRARLALFVEVCKAVQYAHANLVVHQDLKPANVLVDEQGVVKLLDFGIARFLRPEGPQSRPAAPLTTRVMTPEYASPEQLTGTTLTTATDVYSLGIVLYELLTGRRPFEGPWRSPGEYEHAITTQLPLRPSTVVARTDEVSDETRATFAGTLGSTPEKLQRRLAGDLDRIVLLALRKEPERRYGSAKELAEDVERHLAGRPVLAREDSWTYRTAKLARRNALALAAVALTFLGLLIGLILSLRGESRARAESVHAQVAADSFDRIADFLMEALLSAEAHADEETRARTLRLLARQAGLARRQCRDPRLLANLLDALGNTAVALGAYDEGEALLREAHDIRTSESGAESLAVAQSLASLGQLDYRRGHFASAEQYLRRALELQRASPARIHSDVALAANDLAAVLRNRGATEEALALHLEALELRRREEPRGLAVAESLNNLSGIYAYRGELSRARELLEEALAIRAEVAGPEHPLTLQSLSNLAGLLSSLGETERCRELLLRAVAGHRALGVEDQDGLASALSNLAMTEITSGELDAAEACIEEAWSLLHPRLGAHPRIVLVTSLRAIVRDRRGDLAGAEAVWREALEAARGEDIPPTSLCGVLVSYGGFLRDRNRGSEAEELIAEAIDILQSASTIEPLALARAHLELGAAYWERAALAEAERELLLGLELFDQTPATPPAERELWRTRLGEVQSALGERGGH